MYAGKPIIGIAGGIGSGKTFLARMLGDMGCCVIDSDQQVRDAYREPAVIEQLRQWWGEAIIDEAGEPRRSVIAARIFGSAVEKQRLEQLLHPRVAKARDELMERVARDGKFSRILAFVWDTPLLFETGLNRECDAIIFVEAPLAERQRRVLFTRRWEADQLAAREISQWPLDKKRALSDYVLTSTADAEDFRAQAKIVLSQIIDAAERRTRP